MLASLTLRAQRCANESEKNPSQLAAFTQLRDQEYRAFILVDLKETDNVRVGEILEDVDFIHETSLFTFIKLQLVNHLDSAHLTVCFIRGLLDLAKGSGAEDFIAHSVILRERLHIVVFDNKIFL